MRDYSAEELLELSGWEQPKKVELGASGRYTGVIMPRDYTQGEIVPPAHARTLAAQLLAAADLHDAIYDNGFEQGRATEQLETRRKANTTRGVVRARKQAH